MKRVAQFLSFKTRILIVVLVLFLVGIWGFALRFIVVMQADIEKLLADQMATTASYVATDIDRKIKLRMNSVEEIARAITPAMMADPASVQSNLQARELLLTIFPSGIKIMNKDGIAIAERPQIVGRKGDSFTERSYFQVPMATGLTTVDPPIVGRYTGKPLFTISAPVRDAAGNRIGVVAGSLYPSDPGIFGLLEETKLGHNGFFLVIAPKSRLIISATDQRRIMQSIPKGANPVLDRRVEEGFEGPAVGVASTGVRVFTVARHMKTTDWMVIPVVPVEEAFAPIVNLKQEIYLLALLMTLATVVILRYVLARQFAPLEEAGRKMRRMIEDKEAFAPIPVKQKDEIGELVESFNDLVRWRMDAEHQIRFIAHHDALTGLPNRLLVQDRFEHAKAYAERAHTKVALMFLDLDKFKTINDSLGHVVGDSLLKQVASRLAECVRDTDTISRQGGDEFLVVLPDLHHADETALILTKLMESLQLPFHADGHELATSVSLGVAIYPEDGEDFEVLLKKADMAMYRAKGAGRNTYCFYDEQMNSEALESLSMSNGLKRAVTRGEFELHYQPQIEIDSGAIVGAEALIRWNHPELGMIFPSRFIAVAEERGFIVPIGDWVIHEACRQAMVWRRAGLPALTVAVNLSAMQFKRGDLEQTVSSALKQSGLEPGYLELELTESMLIHDTESVLATVRQLKTLGVKLSIDDFGTGYSSLSYLKRFAVDKIKIDQSFIRDLASDPDDAEIVRAIVQMAHGLNLKTVAEGVESLDMLDKLRVFQCDEAQGYHFARPMAAEDFARHMAQKLALPHSS